MNNHYRGPSIDASYQVSIHWTKRIQRRTLLEIDKTETRISCGGHLCQRIGTRGVLFQRTFQECFLPNVASFGKAVSEEKMFQKSTNQKKELPVTAMFVNRSRRNEQSLQRTFHRCFLPSFDSLNKALSEENFFRNRPIRNKICLQQSCLLTNRDE